MKRTLLLTLEYPPDRGGIASTYSRLAAHLPEDRFRVLHLRLLRWFWPQWIAHPLSVARARRTFNYEALLVGHALPLGYVALLYKIFFNVPYGVFVHGLDLLRPQKNPWKRFWLRAVLRRASVIIANSEWTRKKATESGAQNVMVLYPSVIPPLSPPLFQGGRLSGGIRILSVGRLVPRKGFDVLIRAFEIVRRTVPTATLEVVGDGPERARLELLVKKTNLTDSVHFRGPVSDEELSRCYASVALFVLPTRETADDAEGFGLVFLEAAAHGLAAVAGRGGGVGESVLDGKTGLIVDSTNPQAVAGAVIKLLTDGHLRRQLGEAGRERALRDFNSEKQSAHLISTLETI